MWDRAAMDSVIAVYSSSDGVMPFTNWNCSDTGMPKMQYWVSASILH